MSQPSTEWAAIEHKLTELVMDHLLTNKDDKISHFDSNSPEIQGHQMNEFSKEFLSKYITKIRDAWLGLSLKLIPAEEIPMRRHARV
ncbi:hypothetical protein FF38_06698 [Lucilia cuprina]|uniref:Uncharacterized protein n=1 Tax=Lucilia cuprina TaxID=7375 RepID=A0A0L0C1M7_LUCCU|nr:hypothetical protein FF38_06698 [Lucilia cuprina]